MVERVFHKAHCPSGDHTTATERNQLESRFLHRFLFYFWGGFSRQTALSVVWQYSSHPGVRNNIVGVHCRLDIGRISLIKPSTIAEERWVLAKKLIRFYCTDNFRLEVDWCLAHLCALNHLWDDAGKATCDNCIFRSRPIGFAELLGIFMSSQVF